MNTPDRPYPITATALIACACIIAFGIYFGFASMGTARRIPPYVITQSGEGGAYVMKTDTGEVTFYIVRNGVMTAVHNPEALEAAQFVQSVSRDKDSKLRLVPDAK